MHRSVLNTLIPLLILAPLIAGCAINPATGKREINFVSRSQEVNMGREADKQILAQYGAYADTSLADFVDRVGQTLAAVSERPDLEWHFRVLDSPVVNAFALPGGYIYITRGILAALNSEAQLAGVLGHEIGHVTARHSAQQITRSQLAGVGLLAGMILVDDVARYGDVLQGSLGLLFLKFGRDDENQADQLGIRYAVKAGYDPREIPATYDMLNRLAQRTGGGGLPTWMSTHPDPGDRKVRTSTQAHEAVLLHGEASLAVEEESFKKRLDGLVYGDDPRSGYLVDNHFYHPELGFEMDWPNGWNVQNSAAAVTGQSPDGKAGIQFTIENSEDGPDEPAAYVDWLAEKGELSNPVGRTRVINGADVWIGRVNAGGKPLALAFVDRGDGSFYQFVGIPGSSDAAGRFQNTVESFGPLRDPEKRKVRADQIDLVRAPGDRTIEAIVTGEPNIAKPADEIGWINNYFLHDTPPRDKTLKMVRRSTSPTPG